VLLYELVYECAVRWDGLSLVIARSRVATGVICGIGRHAGRAARGLCQVSPLAVAGLSGMKT
jgi:hypothetical protein